MFHIREALQDYDTSLQEIPLRADRLKIAKRLWRSTAEDGADFGIEVDTPLSDGDVVWVSDRARYVVRQTPEPVLEIPLDVSPEAAALIGWAVGNMHFVIEAQSTRLLAPDDPGLRQALDRASIHYHRIVEIFKPHRWSGTFVGHSHGHHNGHGHAHHH